MDVRAVVPCGRTDRHDEAISHLLQFCERASKCIHMGGTNSCSCYGVMCNELCCVWGHEFWLSVGLTLQPNDVRDCGKLSLWTRALGTAQHFN